MSLAAFTDWIDVLPLPALLAAVSAFFVGNTLLGLAIGYAMERTTKRPIWNVPKPPTQLAFELKGNVIFVLVCVAALTPALYFDVARLGAESVARIAGTFFALLLGFQVFYYAFHRALHTHALVRFHRWHHESRVTSPMSGQSMSVVEAVGWMVGYVVIPIGLSFVAPISLIGWLAYLSFNILGNIFGHANAEVMKPARVGAFTPGFIYHALHHARWTGHYGFESTWADALFNTTFKDWRTLHARIWAGTALTSLKERGDLQPLPVPMPERRLESPPLPVPVPMPERRLESPHLPVPVPMPERRLGSPPLPVPE